VVLSPIPKAKIDQYIQIVYNQTIEIIATTIEEIAIILTLSLILPIPANTEKLNQTNIVKKEIIVPQRSNSPEKTNF
jgi:hypothetical protein